MSLTYSEYKIGLSIEPRGTLNARDWASKSVLSILTVELLILKYYLNQLRAIHLTKYSVFSLLDKIFRSTVSNAVLKSNNVIITYDSEVKSNETSLYILIKAVSQL